MPCSLGFYRLVSTVLFAPYKPVLRHPTPRRSHPLLLFANFFPHRTSPQVRRLSLSPTTTSDPARIPRYSAFYTVSTPPPPSESSVNWVILSNDVNKMSLFPVLIPKLQYSGDWHYYWWYDLKSIPF